MITVQNHAAGALWNQDPKRPPWLALGVSVAVVVALLLAYAPLLPLLAHLAGSQPPLIVIIILPFLMVYGLLARSYGVHLLFWHERPGRRAVAAFGLTLLVVNFVAVAYYVSIRPRDDIASDYLCRGMRAFYERWEGVYPGLRLPPDSITDGTGAIHAAKEECPAFFANESLKRISMFLLIAVPPPLLLLALPVVFPRLARLPVQNLSPRRWAANLLAWIVGVVVGLFAAYGLFWAGRYLHDKLHEHRVLDTAKFLRIERQLDEVNAINPLLKEPPKDRTAWVNLRRRVDDLYRHFSETVDSKQLQEQRRKLQTLQKALDAGNEIRTAFDAINRHWEKQAQLAMARSELRALSRLPFDDQEQAPEVFGDWDEEAKAHFAQIGPQVEHIGKALEQQLEEERKMGVIRRATLSLFLIQMAFFGLFALVVPLFRFVISAFAICLLFSILATTYMAYVSLFPADGRWTLLLLVGFVGAVAALNFRAYKLTFPGLDKYYEGKPASLEKALDANFLAVPGKISDDQALVAWSRNHPDFQQGGKPKLVLVAVSGGAARSALWVALVLDMLGQKIQGFASHIRVFSGASGGMVGAAYYVAALRRYRDEGRAKVDPALKEFPADKVVTTINRDSLDVVAKQLLLRDLPSILQFWSQSNDRGRVLEATWEGGGLNVPFGEFAQDELDGCIPSLILSPMMVEDGRRLIISNLELPYMTAAADRTLIDRETETRYGRRLSTSAVEFRTLFDDPKRPPDLPLSTAVRMSASFPYVSPAVNLPTEPLRSVVDAGYYDNYGISVATSWLFRHRDRLRDLTSGVVLVQIRDQVSQESRLGTGAVKKPGPLHYIWDGFRFFSSPLQGAGSARYASTSFRNDEYLMHLSAMLNRDADDFFTTVAFESGADVALNWTVSDAELDCLRAQFERRIVEGCETNINLDRIAKLAAWWAMDHSGSSSPAGGRGDDGQASEATAVPRASAPPDESSPGGSMAEGVDPTAAGPGPQPDKSSPPGSVAEESSLG
jgi:hypothetical protein